MPELGTWQCFIEGQRIVKRPSTLAARAWLPLCCLSRRSAFNEGGPLPSVKTLFLLVGPLCLGVSVVKIWMTFRSEQFRVVRMVRGNHPAAGCPQPRGKEEFTTEATKTQRKDEPFGCRTSVPRCSVVKSGSPLHPDNFAWFGYFAVKNSALFINGGSRQSSIRGIRENSQNHTRSGERGYLCYLRELLLKPFCLKSALHPVLTTQIPFFARVFRA